ncbi:hypothetical protein J6590_002837 [Homalodisca vitripennis]|nr:hypothetical protein J6590_002837 [Homalodisca vitripennis]
MDSPMTKHFADLLGSFDLVWSIDILTKVTSTSATTTGNVISNLSDIRLCVITQPCQTAMAIRQWPDGHSGEGSQTSTGSNQQNNNQKHKAFKHCSSKLFSFERDLELHSTDTLELQLKQFEENVIFHMNYGAQHDTWLYYSTTEEEIARVRETFLQRTMFRCGFSNNVHQNPIKIITLCQFTDQIAITYTRMRPEAGTTPNWETLDSNTGAFAFSVRSTVFQQTAKFD